MHQTLDSISKLNHEDWTVFLVNTGEDDYKELAQIASVYNSTGKILIFDASLPAALFDHNRAYRLTDIAIEERCLSDTRFDWMLISNGAVNLCWA